MDCMQWTKEKCLCLIEEFEKRTFLWNPNDPLYLNNESKEEAWAELAGKFKMTVEDIKRKMQSLKGTFRRERSRMKSKFGTDSGMGDRHISKWFAYRRMMFLEDRGDASNTSSLNQSYKSEKDIQEVQEKKRFSTADLLKDSFLIRNDERTCMQGIQPKIGKNTKKRNFLPRNILPRPPPKILPRPPTKIVSHPPVRLQSVGDTRIPNVYAVLKNSDPSRDDCTIYGEYVANTLRKLDKVSQAIVRHKINEALFEAEMSNYKSSVSSSESVPVHPEGSQGSENEKNGPSSKNLPELLHHDYHCVVDSSEK